MVKNRHSKDRLYVTATEWATEYGGKKDEKNVVYRPLPFDHCGLTLSPFHDPVCLEEGVIFDSEALLEHVLKYKSNPITGAPVSTKDIIRLNITKNDAGKYICPVSGKEFTNSSHIVAIKTTGNVYSFDSVNEMNIKTKNYVDLISGEPFARSDIITLQNPQDPSFASKRDINSYHHMKVLKEESKTTRDNNPKIRFNSTAESIMKNIEKKKLDESKEDKKSIEDYVREINSSSESVDDIQSFLSLKATIDDVNPGQVATDGKASSSFTSSSVACWTSNATRLAKPSEIRDALWRTMRRLGKKAYIQLQTSKGNLNLEIHCDITPRTAFNFVNLCNKNYYDHCMIHRLIPGFMMQTGDPTGTGSGGESVWKNAFADEFDSRLEHGERGILSMANSGPNSNKSQFFITFAPAKHLNLKHTVFGRIVGGMTTLQRIEEVPCDKRDKPKESIEIISAAVLVNPIPEAENLLLEEIRTRIQSRLNASKQSALPAANPPTSAGAKRKQPSPQDEDHQSKVDSFLASHNSLGSSSIKEDNKKKKTSSIGFSSFSSW